MKQSYPTANVIMLFTLLTPMLFGIVMGLPLGIFILPMIVASMLYGFCLRWRAAFGWRHGARVARCGGGCTRQGCARRWRCA